MLAIICYLICYFLVTERVTPEIKPDERAQNNLMTLFKNAFKNRALISIVVASVLMLMAQLTLQSMANYIYPNYYGNPTAQSISTFAMLFGMLLAASVAKPIARRFGKAEVSTVASLLAAIVCLALFIIRPQNVWVYVAFNFVSWIGLGIFSMVSWALITDVIDYAEIKNGIREDGSIYAMYSFARKLGQAASAGLSGLLLSLVGYKQETAFDTGVLEGIFNISTLVPAIGFALLGLILWFWYPLHKHRVDENVAILREKHEKQ